MHAVLQLIVIMQSLPQLIASSLTTQSLLQLIVTTQSLLQLIASSLATQSLLQLIVTTQSLLQLTVTTQSLLQLIVTTQSLLQLTVTTQSLLQLIVTTQSLLQMFNLVSLYPTFSNSCQLKKVRMLCHGTDHRVLGTYFYAQTYCQRQTFQPSCG